MKKGFGLLLGAALAVGCASSGPPASPALLAEAEAAVHRAEAAGAAERAPDLLAKARHAWDEGRLASSRGEGATATRRLEEAREYARAAEAKANTERMRSDAAALKQQADELEARTRQMRGQTPTP
jgi:vancomycin resistance protein YoaR